MKRPTLILGLAIAATISGACSPGAVPSSTPSAVPSSTPGAVPSPAAATVDGKTYLSTDIKGAVLVPGTRIRLAFKDSRLSASGGCNSMGGAYTITGDRLSVTQLSMTEMSCDEPRMQQDQWLARLLGGATITLAGDTLTLDEGAIHLTLLDREIASPDKPIEGTHWLLDGIVSGNVVSSVPAGVTASISLVAGRVDVEAGCNTGTGTVEVTADELIFGPIGLTRKACEPGAMAVEQAVTGVLAMTAGYTIEADVLTIKAGNAGLLFRAAP